jgi:hypothetical protein
MDKPYVLYKVEKRPFSSREWIKGFQFRSQREDEVLAQINGTLQTLDDIDSL